MPKRKTGERDEDYFKRKIRKLEKKLKHLPTEPESLQPGSPQSSPPGTPRTLISTPPDPEPPKVNTSLEKDLEIGMICLCNA